METPECLAEMVCERVAEGIQNLKRLAAEDELEQASGVRDLDARRRIGLRIVWQKRLLKEAKNKYQKASGKPWSPTLCKP